MKKYSNILYILAFLTLSILTLLLFRLIKLYDILCIITEIVVPILGGYIFAWLLNPIYKKLEKRFNKLVAVLLCILLVITLYIIIFILIVPVFLNEIGNFTPVIEKILSKIKNISFLKIDQKKLKINPEILLDKCGGILNIFINFALINIYGFYLLYNYSLIHSLIRKKIPQKYKEILTKFSKKLSNNMYLYVKGTAIDMVILFGLTLILFYLFKIKYALLLAFFISITNVIPFIGPYIGGIPAVLIGFSSSIKLGIISFAIVLICQLVESNLINPLIMSKCIKINPLLIVITITVMGRLFGIIGMLFAVPSLIFIKIFYEYYKKYVNVLKRG